MATIGAGPTQKYKWPPDLTSAPAAAVGGQPAKPATPGTTTPSTVPAGLTGEDRDAYIMLNDLLKTYGLESLASTVLTFIQQGYSGDTITVLLQGTDAYKKRFSANEARRQKGLAVLSPAEYLATEQAYRQVMSAAGLPPGYYDQPNDFAAMLGNDVSPVEVQKRVTVAADLINHIDPNVLNEWRRWYTTGDIVAYAMDSTRATAVFERQARAATAGAFASEQGLNLSQAQAELVGSTGASEDALRQGMATAGALASRGQFLSGIYGGTYQGADAVSEVFLGDAKAAEKRRGLASQERATFGGASGLTDKSLSRKTAGQV